MTLCTTVTAMSIHPPDGDPICGEQTIHVRLCDEGGGYFVQIETEEGKISLEIDELNAVLAVATDLIGRTEAESVIAANRERGGDHPLPSGPPSFEWTDRGFAKIEVVDTRGNVCRVQRSSLEGTDAVWIFCNHPSIPHKDGELAPHLDAGQARCVAQALLAFADNEDYPPSRKGGVAAIHGQVPAEESDAEFVEQVTQPDARDRRERAMMRLLVAHMVVTLRPGGDVTAYRLQGVSHRLRDLRFTSEEAAVEAAIQEEMGRE